jgi:hypothetical protein
MWYGELLLRRKMLLLGMAVFVLLSSGLVGSAKADTTIWTQVYGGTQWDCANSAVETSDGGYAIAGYTRSFGAGSADFWLIKTDEYGNMEWNRTYGGTDWDRAYSLAETSDGGYAMAGRTDSFGAGNSDFWLIKTNEEGNVEWTKTYGGNGWDYAYSLVETSDGGYAIAGSTSSFGDGGYDFWLIKTDEDGNMEWSQTYDGGATYELAYSVVVTSDGGYALAGYTNSSEGGSGDFWLVKTDEDGNAEWNQTYDLKWPHDAASLIVTSEEGYTLAGGTGPFSGINFCLIGTDAFGNIEWNQTYAGIDLDTPTSLFKSSDGGYLLTGSTNSSGAGGDDFWLMKTDALGNMKWKKTIGGAAWDIAHSLIETSDGKYVLACETFSFGAGSADVWLVKTDGCVCPYEYDTYEYDYNFGYFTYTVVVWTNSTLGTFDFGLYENQISFSVTGPTGTTGFCKIAIPEVLVGDDFSVCLNEELLVEGIDYTTTYNSTHTILDITYSHSLHRIEITGTTLVPEGSSWLLPSSLLAATMVIVIYKKKHST